MGSSWGSDCHCVWGAALGLPHALHRGARSEDPGWQPGWQPGPAGLPSSSHVIDRSVYVARLDRSARACISGCCPALLMLVIRSQDRSSMQHSSKSFTRTPTLLSSLSVLFGALLVCSLSPAAPRSPPRVWKGSICVCTTLLTAHAGRSNSVLLKSRWSSQLDLI
jgi:hypothetical protein